MLSKIISYTVFIFLFSINLYGQQKDSCEVAKHSLRLYGLSDSVSLVFRNSGNKRRHNGIFAILLDDSLLFRGKLSTVFCDYCGTIPRKRNLLQSIITIQDFETKTELKKKFTYIAGADKVLVGIAAENDHPESGGGWAHCPPYNEPFYYAEYVEIPQNCTDLDTLFDCEQLLQSLNYLKCKKTKLFFRTKDYDEEEDDIGNCDSVSFYLDDTLVYSGILEDIELKSQKYKVAEIDDHFPYYNLFHEKDSGYVKLKIINHTLSCSVQRFLPSVPYRLTVCYPNFREKSPQIRIIEGEYRLSKKAWKCLESME